MDWLVIRNRIIYITILVVLAGISVVPSYYGSIYMYKGHVSKTWTPTTGTMKQSKMKTKLGSDSKYKITYEFLYEYSADGLVYTSGRNSYKAKGGDVTRVAGKLRVGERVMVYFNPSNPAESVLEPGYSLHQAGWFLIGFVAFGLCVVAIVIVAKGQMDNTQGKKIWF